MENVPYNVIPVTEYDPFEVRKYSRIVRYYKIMSTCFKSDFVASGKLYISEIFSISWDFERARFNCIPSFY